MSSVKITDMDIQALIDNELDPVRQRILLETIETSPDLYKRFTMYLHQKKLLKLWHKDN